MFGISNERSDRLCVQRPACVCPPACMLVFVCLLVTVAVEWFPEGDIEIFFLHWESFVQMAKKL